MGGMIAQTMAIEQPQRVRSLTSIMSTTGKRTVGWQHPSLLPACSAGRARAARRYVESQRADVAADRLARLPADRGARPRAGAAETYDRGRQRPAARCAR